MSFALGALLLDPITRTKEIDFYTRITHKSTNTILNYLVTLLIINEMIKLFVYINIYVYKYILYIYMDMLNYNFFLIVWKCESIGHIRTEDQLVVSHIIL